MSSSNPAVGSSPTFDLARKMAQTFVSTPWDAEEQQSKLEDCHLPIIPTTERWHHVNTRDWRKSQTPCQCDPKVGILNSKDKIGYCGVLAYANGDPHVQHENYLGHMRPLDDPQTAANPLAGIRLVMGNPADDAPFVGFGFKIPRQKGLAWSFYDRTDDKQNYHQAYLRFRCGDFEMRWDVLQPHCIAVMQQFFEIPAGKPILAIRLRMAQGKSPEAIGFSWPSFAANGHGTDVTKEFPTILAAKQWTFYVVDNDLYRTKFASIGRTFAEIGRGPNINQYLTRGRVNLQWNPPEMVKFCSNQPHMADHPDFFHAQKKFTSWNELNLREGWGTAFDHLWVEQYALLLRSTPIASQCVEDVKGKKDNFTVSVTIPNLGVNVGTLLKVEDELEVVFVPKVDTNACDENGERLEEPEGWPAVIVERDTINHSGTHLIKVSRRYFGSLLDEQQIISYDHWSKWCSYQNIYLRLKENAKTVKARLNALNMMHPDAKPAGGPNPPRIRRNEDDGTVEDILWAGFPIQLFSGCHNTRGSNAP